MRLWYYDGIIIYYDSAADNGNYYDVTEYNNLSEGDHIYYLWQMVLA